MKRLIASLVLLIVLVAWWATSTNRHTISTENHSDTPVAYPVDFNERLKRISRIQLECREMLPEDMSWETAENQPALGDPSARKGGTVRMSNAGPFPAHFLRFGGSSAQFFHQNLYAATEIPLLTHHPLTGQLTAGVAEGWAKRGDTYYLQLNPCARYNNGRPIRANDYLLSILLQAELQCSEFDTLSEHIKAVCSYGERYLSITLQEKADIHIAMALLSAAEPGFYQQFDSRFREQYAQRIPPNTGPYYLSKIEKGRYIELRRIDGWWGQNIPLCRYRFNADTLEYHFLNAEAQVWDFFLSGKLDALQTRNVAAWQERLAEHPEIPTLVYDAEYPMPPYGIAINTRTVSDINLRRGILQAMDMNKAVEIIFRGEVERLTTFSSGYGKLSPSSTPQYHFSPEKARASFAAAGYTEAGSDGVLQNQAGERLSLRLLYSPNEKISTMVSILVQSAAICGAEIIPEPLPWQNCQRQIDEYCHELTFWAVPAPSLPQPEQFFSSSASPAFNPFSLDSQDMQIALADFNATPTAENLARIDRIVYESAIWLPGWKENRVFLAHHQRLKMPPCLWCYDALDTHTFWVVSTAP